jgi:hypothetical protein
MDKAFDRVKTQNESNLRNFNANRKGIIKTEEKETIELRAMNAETLEKIRCSEPTVPSTAALPPIPKKAKFAVLMNNLSVTKGPSKPLCRASPQITTEQLMADEVRILPGKVMLVRYK